MSNLSKSSKKLLSWMSFAFALMLNPIRVFASTIEDNVGNVIPNSSAVSEDQAVADLLQGFRPMGAEQLAQASNTLSPLVNIIGYVMGGIIVLTFLAVSLITAVDLLYIAFPPIRNLLYKPGQYQQQGGAGGYNAGGYGAGGYGRGGYGAGGYGAGGYGAGGYGQMNAQGGAAGLLQRISTMQIISDEAVQCVSILDTSNAQAQTVNGATGVPTGEMSRKSVISMYLKKRAFFMILLAFCVIVLTSSLLLDTGINLAQWFVKIGEMVNTKIPK